jgi:two-component system, chemotaxis family, chemotaxis protein CheY
MNSDRETTSTSDPLVQRSLADGLPVALIKRIGSVLVVDDEPIMRTILCSVFEKLGIVTVEVANDAVTALELARSNRYGLILSDIQMEPMNGIELLRSLRGTNNATTPVLLTTGIYSTKIAAEAKEVGARWFILKPFSTQQIGRKLREIFP